MIVKTRLIKIFIMLTGFILLIMLAISSGAYFSIAYGEEHGLTANEIIKKVTDVMNPKQSSGQMEMITVTTSGKKRTFVYNYYSKEHGEKNMIKYIKPRRVKDQVILMLNNADDIWVYFPRTRRVRKLATHAKKQKMEGSDFSYEDMGSGNTFIEDFDSRLIGEEKAEGEICYKLELERRPKSSSGYSRIIMWVEKVRFVPLVIDYYHDDNPELWEKRLVCSDIKIIDDIPTPLKYIMYNKLDDTSTSMDILDIKYDVGLEDSLFTERGMKK